MAEVTIRFRFDKTTGAKELVIQLDSESDALPHEHERDHRAWAEALLGRALDEDIQDVVVERMPKGDVGLGAVEGQPGAARAAHPEKS